MPQSRRALLIATILTTAAASLVAAAPAAAAGSTVSALTLLHGLKVASHRSASGFSSSRFGGWIDADRDCEDTRAEVLRAESTRPVAETSQCIVTSGAWLSTLDGRRLTAASSVTVTRLVPVKNAWLSGAASWSADRRRAFANDTAYGASLLAVSAKAAKAKGSADPSKYLPAARADRCSYVRSWIAVKSRWHLTVTRSEASALRRDLHRYCRSTAVAKPATPDVAALTGSGSLPAATAAPTPTAAPTATPVSAPTTGAPVAPAPASAPTVSAAPPAPLVPPALPVPPTSTAPTPTPTPTPSAASTPTPTPTPSPTTTPTPSAASTPTPAPTAAGPLRPLASAAGAGSLTLQSGVYDFADFLPDAGDSFIGVQLPTGGVQGVGAGATVLQMTPTTSTRADAVPTAVGTTNQLSLLRVAGSPTLAGFTLRGTAQGHDYNGLRLQQTVDARVQDVTVTGVPGSDRQNPGETFGINDYRGLRSQYSHVTVDGQGIGAAGLGVNSSTTVGVADSTFTNNPFSAGITFWQAGGGITLTNVRSTYNRTGMNFERTSGTVTITNPVFAGDGVDLHLGSDQSSAQITVVDPTYDGSKLRIQLSPLYQGVPNTQLQSDIHVFVGGVDRTADVVQWIR